MKNGRPLLAYFGHHKCATRWMNGVLRASCRELGLRHKVVWDAEMFGRDLPGFVAREGVDFLAYTNADYWHVCSLNDVRGFHMVRDPRDICVSAYFSHLYSHETTHWPELEEHRLTLQALPKDEGLLADMAFNEVYMREMDSWDYENPNFLQVRMEDVTGDPFRQIPRIFEFLGLLGEVSLPIRRRIGRGISTRAARWSGRHLNRPGQRQQLTVETVLRIVWQNDFTVKSGGRVKGQSDHSGHYRKGVPGDWREHFTEAHVSFFKERYNPLLLKLGYEKTWDWKVS